MSKKFFIFDENGTRLTTLQLPDTEDAYESQGNPFGWIVAAMFGIAIALISVDNVTPSNVQPATINAETQVSL